MRLRTWIAIVVFALGSGGCQRTGFEAGQIDITVFEPDAAVDQGRDGVVDVTVASPSADAAVPLRVLFVGNSYTYVNDLPAVVHAIGAVTPGAAVEVASVVKGGATLSDHWMITGARVKIATGGFGAVVLQGQSLEPITAQQEFDYYAKLFGGAVYDAGARAVWFATWARRADQLADAPWGVTPGTMTDFIEERYRWAAVHGGGLVARVGTAWQLALAEQPDVALHAVDGSHPTAAGTLLTACVILQTLTEQLPRLPDPPPLGIPRETASALCALAPRVASIRW